MTKLVNVMSLGIINRLLGGVFGGPKISLLISVLILVLNNLDKINCYRRGFKKINNL